MRRTSRIGTDRSVVIRNIRLIRVPSFSFPNLSLRTGSAGRTESAWGVRWLVIWPKFALFIAVVGSAKLTVFGHVEELGSKLNRVSFANWELLLHGHVNADDAVRVGNVGAGVAERELRRQDERACVEPLIRRLRTRVGVAHQVGTLVERPVLAIDRAGRNQ